MGPRAQHLSLHHLRPPVREMPYSNVPAGLTSKMDSCVKSLVSKGKTKKQAIAICYDSVVNGGVAKAANRRKGGS